MELGKIFDMSIEHGIRLGSRGLSGFKDPGRMTAMLGKFEWVYLGAEFCENLLEEGVCAEAVRLQKEGKKVCLLTPLLTEKGIGRLSAVFKKLRGLWRAGRLDAARLEITVNDFGAMALAAREKLPFKLSAGRQFSYNSFALMKDSVKVLNRLALEFFAQRGVDRYEISAAGAVPRTNFGKGSCFAGEKFSFSVYYPYLNLTTTRTCLVGMPYIAPEDSMREVSCRQECRACAFKVAHPWIKEKLLIRGNTVFMEFPEKFYSSEKELEALHVDRLVYCPFP